ncbi:zf-HC2 domain-containing protein [Oerskovia turbata]|uniref:Zf-HC2 domain-containing protein n=1 Tax=Oerskovia turbata TaxID=1713 RepID=A0A4Q1L3A4_9CELL|nr:zf-HC2 domain-containing protein [Oerskovia turbata]RXR26302.1 zf-HC2 domain-containing protein [Oerskovia turbata]RXR36804.1 zf-HC2 domain-containing protein [Oerskovia turbata]
MTHLGTLVSALADDQLSPATRERALTHVAGCDQCAAELAVARAVRKRLSCARDVLPTTDLTSRLLALSSEIPAAQGDPLRQGPPARDPWAASPEVGALRGALTGDFVAHARRRRSRRTLVAASSGLAVLAVALFTLGDRPVVVPDRHVAAPLTLLAQAGDSAQDAADPGLVPVRPVVGGSGTSASGAASTDSMDLTDSAALAWMADHGWTSPSGILDGFDVTGVHLVGDDRDVLQVDLAGPEGTVVVREQVGRLDTTSLTRSEGFDGRAVYVLSDEPWHVVWQAGDTVIDVVAEARKEVLAAFVATFPAHDFDAGVPARISRGWTTMTGALGTP